MISSRASYLSSISLIQFKIRDYLELVKLRLSFLVVFSSAFGYLLGSRGSINWVDFIMFSIGGFMVSGASITINQILEKDYDKLMKRTKNRPIPTGRVSITEAIIFAGILSVLGFSLLLVFSNIYTALLSMASMIMYSFLYTPLKRIGPVAVFVGAFPGAFPPLLGWLAATGTINYEALIIFGIQFIWQFPHFWAIAWIADEDYKKAGFKLLPFGGKKDLNTAIQIMVYTLFLIPLGLLPAKIGLTGINSAVIATFCGVLFLAQTFTLMKEGTKKAALKIMYGSFLYLPIVQISYLLDKV